MVIMHLLDEGDTHKQHLSQFFCMMFISLLYSKVLYSGLFYSM